MDIRRALLVCMAVALSAGASASCELAVELDRSAVDAGPEAACPICGDADAGEDGAVDAKDAADADAD